MIELGESGLFSWLLLSPWHFQLQKIWPREKEVWIWSGSGSLNNVLEHDITLLKFEEITFKKQTKSKIYISPLTECFNLLPMRGEKGTFKEKFNPCIIENAPVSLGFFVSFCHCVWETGWSLRLAGRADAIENVILMEGRQIESFLFEGNQAKPSRGFIDCI